MAETVVSEADLPERSEGSEGVGKEFYLVDSQAECVEFGQHAELCGEAGQAIVTQVQYLEVFQLADDRRELSQLGEEHKIDYNTQNRLQHTHKQITKHTLVWKWELFRAQALGL